MKNYKYTMLNHAISSCYVKLHYVIHWKLRHSEQELTHLMPVFWILEWQFANETL